MKKNEELWRSLVDGWERRKKRKKKEKKWVTYDKKKRLAKEKEWKLDLAAKEKKIREFQLKCSYCDLVLGDDELINKREDNLSTADYTYLKVYDCKFCGGVVFKYTEKWWDLTESGKEGMIERMKHSLEFNY